MKKHIFLLLILLVSAENIYAQHSEDDHTSYNCYTIIAGKDATADGSVLLAHNEDNWGEQMLSMYIMPKSDTSARYLWINMMGQLFADTYLNEYGVAVVSNKCRSREDREDYTDGGIDYYLRTTVAQKATSARHAVEIIGELVEKYGYASSGRSYSIADHHEGWLVAIVQGRNWVAQRIDDNKVMVIPNYYTIENVDLKSPNFLGSDVVGYAKERGWYDPAKDGKFSFREVYSDPNTLNSMNNKGRKWAGVNFFSKKQYEIEDSFPFQFKPKKKVTVEDMKKILTSHFEGTELERTKSTPSDNPHSEKGTICNAGTQSSTIFQLKGLPILTEAVMWIAMVSPCKQNYIPYPFGTESFPDGFAAYPSPQEALENQFTITKDFKQHFPNAIYWEYKEKAL